MHRMADELKTSRRREHRWKLILWSPKNTKEEERKETIEQNTRWPKESHPDAIGAHTKDLRIHTFKSPQTSQGATKHKIGRGNLHGSSCSPYHHHPVDQNGPVSAKKAKNRKPRENCHIHPTKSNSYDVCTSQSFLEATTSAQPIFTSKAKNLGTIFYKL
ncbi:unnamed protein product [Microthlaspi erraticum]|uniref:Uncharacterized protein n=1 Tax=Microthlaspi erraticum TaxID=1685480 RepID=A0A6D2IEL9_9BRAS|nr:unnamed protein product [Microthlaspi erraticum]